MEISRLNWDGICRTPAYYPWAGNDARCWNLDSTAISSEPDDIGVFYTDVRIVKGWCYVSIHNE
jgi:hypothetical protein